MRLCASHGSRSSRRCSFRLRSPTIITDRDHTRQSIYAESIKERVALRTPTSQVATLLHRLAVRALIKDYQQDNSTTLVLPYFIWRCMRVRACVRCSRPSIHVGVWHYRFARVKDELKRPGAAMSVQHYARAEMTKLALLYSVVSPFTCLSAGGISPTTIQSATNNVIAPSSGPTYSPTGAPAAAAPAQVAYRYYSNTSCRFQSLIAPYLTTHTHAPHTQSFVCAHVPVVFADVAQLGAACRSAGHRRLDGRRERPALPHHHQRILPVAAPQTQLARLPPHLSQLFAHVAKLQPCVAGLLTHLTQLQPNIASLLTHLTSLLAHITFLFAHLAQLQSNIAVVLAHVAVLLAHIAVLLAHVAGLYADGAHEPQPDSERLRRGSGQHAPERDPNLRAFRSGLLPHLAQLLARLGERPPLRPGPSRVCRRLRTR
jgi:hypothetical protein